MNKMQKIQHLDEKMKTLTIIYSNKLNEGVKKSEILKTLEEQCLFE